MNEIILRPYQEKFIADVRNEFLHGQKRVVGVAPCGAGKTIMTGWMIRETFQNGKKAIFFVHRKELIDQTADTFRQLHIPFGIVASGVQPNYDAPVQIASVQALVNRLNEIPSPSLLVCDECHHILADSYKRIIDHWQNTFLLGVTATPQRIGGTRLGDVFSSMVLAPSVPELIKLGNLTNFEYFTMDISIQTTLLEDELKKIAIKQGDYQRLSLSNLMVNPIITSAIVDSYKKHAIGKSAICYCVDVAHSKHVANFFNNAGIPAAHCDGNTPKQERNAIVNDFRQGKYKVLCNAELFGEGFDVPNCHAVILARPTKSLTLHIQQSMRSMRPDPADPNKVAIIIDCVKNCNKHGKPDDRRNWSLAPNKAKNDGVAPTKICPKCKNPVNASVDICPKCGYDFTKEYFVNNATTAEHIYSSVENKKAPSNDITIIRAPRSIEDFISIANKKGYKTSWAVYKALDFVKSYNDLLHIADVVGYKKGWAYYKAFDLHISTKKDVAKSPVFC